MTFVLAVPSRVFDHPPGTVSSLCTYLLLSLFQFLLRQAFATMRFQQDFSRSFCSCWCPPLLSCSFLVPLSLLSHYLSTSLVVFLCFLFPSLVRIALLPVVCFPPSLLRARTTSAFFF